MEEDKLAKKHQFGKDNKIIDVENNLQEELKSGKHQGENRNVKIIGLQDRITNNLLGFLKNPYNIAFLILVGVVLWTRIKYFYIESIWNDAAVHLWRSSQLVNDPFSVLFTQEYWLGDYQIPQTLTGVYYFFVRDAFIAGKIMAYTYTVLGLIMIYILGTEVRDKFTGLVAAILLGFNHMFWFYSVRPLGDAPLVVAVLFLLFCIVKLDRQETLFWGVLTGFAFFITMLHKVQSVIFVIAYLLYLLIFKTRDMFTNKPRLFSWLIPAGVIFTGDVAAKILFNRLLLGRIWNLFKGLAGMPFGYEASGMIKWIFTWQLIVPAIIGALLIILYRKKIYYPILVFFGFYWYFFEINIDNTQDRYMLPLLPLGIIFAVFAFVEIAYYISYIFTVIIKFGIRRLVPKFNKYVHKFVSVKIISCILVLFVVFTISSNYYNLGNSIIQGKQYSYIGHRESGQWFRENTPEDAIIFSGSPRMLRAFALREYYNEGHEDSPTIGGPIIWLRGDKYLEEFHPGDEARQNFEKDLEEYNKKGDVYVQIDIWEYTQPRWYYPIKQQSIEYFISKGFKLVKVVEKEMPANNGLQKVPVIFIFKKDKVNVDEN